MVCLEYQIQLRAPKSTIDINSYPSSSVSQDLDNLSPADELELYYQAHRRLKNLLSKQTQVAPSQSYHHTSTILFN